MALIKCPECGGQVSDKATTCPHCGYPISSAPKENTGINKNVYQAPEIKHLAPMKLFNVNDDKIDIECGNCKKIYSYKRKYFIVQDDESCICNADIICPNCKNGVEKGTRIARENGPGGRETIRCPRCGSTQITTGQRGYSIFWGPIGAGSTVNRCAKCGYSWKPGH